MSSAGSTVRRGLRAALLPLVMGVVLFGAAGRADLWAFWAYLLAVGLPIVLGAIAIDDPDLARERLKPGGPGLDAGRLRRLGPLAVLAHLVTAGLDVGRFGWSPPVPLLAQSAGLVVVAGGVALVVWSMRANTFFSPIVRVQAERGHRVVTDGPYRIVRHPGYTGMVLFLGGGGLALGSLWALAPGLAYVMLVIRRTVVEDRFLMEQLEGYPEYADRVRARLVPGVW